jgi:inner membrane protease subunit 1
MWTTGDNLPHSLDSRAYGPVPLGLVKGKVLAKLYPELSWIVNPLVDDYN